MGLCILRRMSARRGKIRDRRQGQMSVQLRIFVDMLSSSAALQLRLLSEVSELGIDGEGYVPQAISVLAVIDRGGCETGYDEGSACGAVAGDSNRRKPTC